MAGKPKNKASQPVSPEKPASQAIKEIEALIGNRAIIYISKRKLAFWDIPPFYRLLTRLGHQEKLSVILQSRGGFSDDAFKIGNMIHEFTNDVEFIVPSNANSAATMLCLSGSVIYMGPISELGPTNPMMSVDERLITPTVPGPTDSGGETKGKEPKQLQMAAHALRDFLMAAGVLRSDGTGYNPETLSVYMAKGILNPFLLGDFERSTKIAVQYTETFLTNYMFRGREDKASLAQETAKRLCEGYFDHQYPISRREAREILHLNIQDMSNELWELSFELMLAYDRMMDSQNIATIIETSEAFQTTHWAPSA